MEFFFFVFRKLMLLQYSYDFFSINIFFFFSMFDKIIIQLFGILKFVGIDEIYYYVWKVGIFISEIKN